MAEHTPYVIADDDMPDRLFVQMVAGTYHTNIRRWSSKPFPGGIEYTRANTVDDMLVALKAARIALESGWEASAVLTCIDAAIDRADALESRPRSELPGSEKVKR